MLPCRSGSLSRREWSTPSWTQQHRYGASTQLSWLSEKEEWGALIRVLYKQERKQLAGASQSFTQQISRLSKYFQEWVNKQDIWCNLSPNRGHLIGNNNCLDLFCVLRLSSDLKVLRQRLQEMAINAFQTAAERMFFIIIVNPDTIKGQLCQFCRELLFRKCRHSGGRQKDGSGKTDWTKPSSSLSLSCKRGRKLKVEAILY